MGHIVKVNLSADTSQMVNLCTELELSGEAYRRVPSALDRVEAEIEVSARGAVEILKVDGYDLCVDPDTCGTVDDLRDQLNDANIEIKRLELEVEEWTDAADSFERQLKDALND